MQRRPREAQQLFQINATTANVDVKQATRKAHGSHKLQIVFRPTSEHGSAISSEDGRPCGALATGLGIANWDAWAGIKA